jgi:hypothetical protein
MEFGAVSESKMIPVGTGLWEELASSEVPTRSTSTYLRATVPMYSV